MTAGSAVGPIVFLVFCVLLPLMAGYVSRWRGWVDSRWSQPILTVNIACGATTLVLLVIWDVTIDRRLPLLPVVGASLALAMLLVGGVTSRLVTTERRSRGSFAFASCLSNMGYSMGGIVAYALLGEQGYARSIIYLIFWSPFVFGFCFPLARAIGRERLAFRTKDFVAIFRDPRSLPLAGLAAGLALNLSGLSRPVFLSRVTGTIVAVAAASAMFAVGLALFLEKVRTHARVTALMCILKFVVSPLLALGLMALFGIVGCGRQVVLILSVCPVAVYAVVISNLFDLDLDLANSLWVVTTVVFLLVVAPVLVFVVPLLAPTP